MIHFHKISLNIHGQQLLSETDLRISAGDHVVIRGPSGCGKSSLLKLAVGSLPLSGGSVNMGGLELSAATVIAIRSRIAFIGQEPVLGTEKVNEALLLPFTFKTHQPSWPSDEQILQTLEKLHLDSSILEKPVKRISGGEKQRIAIARALLLNKTTFLADEITSALDPESKQAVMRALFQPEITMLSVSHDPEWTSACSREVKIEEHKLMEAGR